MSDKLAHVVTFDRATLHGHYIVAQVYIRGALVTQARGRDEASAVKEAIRGARFVIREQRDERARLALSLNSVMDPETAEMVRISNASRTMPWGCE